MDLAPHGSVHEVFTEIIPEGRTTGAYTLTFHFLGLVPPKGMPALMQRKVGAFDALTRPYPVIEAEEAPKQIKGQKGKR